MLCEILKFVYEPYLLRKIFCLCSQGSLAFIICACQNVLFEKYPDYIIAELDSANQTKLNINIIDNTDNNDNAFDREVLSIVIFKTMRISHINKRSHQIETMRILRFQIEYMIHLNDNARVESVIKMEFLDNI